MKKIYLFLVIVFGLFFIIMQSAKAENIHFCDDIYKLKTMENVEKSGIIKNEYYKNSESRTNWTSFIEITYYPEINNPVKYANDMDKKIEADESKLLLKFIQNKRQNVALISTLENGIENDRAFFAYNIFKYEKHPKKGMMVLKFSKKYPVNTNDDILKTAKEVKSINDDYMERMIISPVPPVVKPEEK